MSERLTEDEASEFAVIVTALNAGRISGASAVQAAVAQTERILADRLAAAEEEADRWQQAALAATAGEQAAEARGAQVVRERVEALADEWGVKGDAIWNKFPRNEVLAGAYALHALRLRAALGVDSSHSGTTNEEGR